MPTEEVEEEEEVKETLTNSQIRTSSNSTNAARRSLFTVIQCVGITYIILPIIFLIFGGPILRELTYLNHLQQKTCNIHDYYPDAKSPAVDLSQTFIDNIDIDSTNNYQIPTWYFKGKSDKPVVIYSHGNAATRCGGYRLKGYNALIEKGYSVVAFDLSLIHI